MARKTSGRATAKVFKTGRSQAVRIPKEYRFACEEVLIERDGDRVILTPRPKTWREYFARAAPRRGRGGGGAGRLLDRARRSGI
ncbi:MAG TPA: type II toxin-antitoxin system VapB family antitoxin [Candidatus Dormibacteraeota bacterium]|nr:type II toxin-antitoxin system VapB family antitoxin [Candidatus Dormibacteraeota bacterium]